MPVRCTHDSSHYYASSVPSTSIRPGSDADSYQNTFGLGGQTSRGGTLKWQCCRCSDGWFSTALDEYCPNCHCARCGNCRYAR